MITLGIVAGITLALGCGPLIQHFVYGVAPYDPKTIVGVSILLLGVAILACWVPARRAVRVDPIIALRQE
jgi:ABC-type antimicrobial peptide transport system permease subunit